MYNDFGGKPSTLRFRITAVHVKNMIRLITFVPKRIIVAWTYFLIDRC